MNVHTQRRRQCQQARALDAKDQELGSVPQHPDDALNDAAEMMRDEFREDRDEFPEMVAEKLSDDVNFCDALHRLCNMEDVQAQDIAEIREAVNAASTAMAREWLDAHPPVSAREARAWQRAADMGVD